MIMNRRVRIKIRIRIRSHESVIESLSKNQTRIRMNPGVRIKLEKE